ncbi:MAG: hypothetical protein AB9919_14530 [Geobacteraceae bacterium]
MNDETSMETNISQETEDNKDAVSVPKEYLKKHPKQHPSFFPMIAICVVVSIGASFATVAGYDRWFAQKVVAVDIKGYIAQQRDNYLAGKLNDDELKKSFDRLETVITAIPKNRVIIMGDAVVRNAETVKP